MLLVITQCMLLPPWGLWLKVGHKQTNRKSRTLLINFFQTNATVVELTMDQTAFSTLLLCTTPRAAWWLIITSKLQSHDYAQSTLSIPVAISSPHNLAQVQPLDLRAANL